MLFKAEFGERFELIKEKALLLMDHAHMSDMILIHNPSEIAIGVFI